MQNISYGLLDQLPVELIDHTLHQVCLSSPSDLLNVRKVSKSFHLLVNCYLTRLFQSSSQQLDALPFKSLAERLYFLRFSQAPIKRLNLKEACYFEDIPMPPVHKLIKKIEKFLSKLHLVSPSLHMNNIDDVVQNFENLKILKFNSLNPSQALYRLSKHCTRLQSLSVTGVFEPDFRLDSLTTLRRLRLVQMKSLDKVSLSSTLRKLTDLEHLDVIRFQLDLKAKEALLQLTKLKALRLSYAMPCHNLLARADFSRLSRLELRILGKHCSPSLFEGLSKLTALQIVKFTSSFSLYLKSTVTVMGDQLRHCTRLCELSLGQDVPFIPQALCRVTTLTKIVILNNSKLKDIPKHITQLASLKLLCLHHCPEINLDSIHVFNFRFVISENKAPSLIDARRGSHDL